MIEMRWLLDPKYHNRKNDHPEWLSNEAYTLQYRQRLNASDYDQYKGEIIGWSDWIDVPYVSEDK